MKKYLFSMLAIAVAVSFSAFTPAHHNARNNFYFFGYNQAAGQSVTARETGTNYTYLPGGDLGTCLFSTNECEVKVSLPSAPATGTTLAAYSSTQIEYNSTTGFPDNGSIFSANLLEN